MCAVGNQIGSIHDKLDTFGMLRQKAVKSSTKLFMALKPAMTCGRDRLIVGICNKVHKNNREGVQQKQKKKNEITISTESTLKTPETTISFDSLSKLVLCLDFLMFI